MMQHIFAGRDGPVEVNLSKDGEAWCYEGQRATLDERGRLYVETTAGTSVLGHAAKVGDVWWVHVHGRIHRWELIEPGASASDDGAGLVAPMPGKVLEVLVSVGQHVAAGEALMVLEAMKMEHRIVATAPSTVAAIHFTAGDQVTQGAALLELEEIN